MKTLYIFSSLLLIDVLFSVNLLAFERPPLPNFKNKVDYVRWTREQIEPHEGENAEVEYKKFYQKINEPGSYYYLRPEQNVDKTIDELVSKPYPWNKKDLSDLDNYIQSLELYLEAYEAGSKYPYFSPTTAEDVNHTSDIFLLHTSNSRILTRAMVTLMWRQKEGRFNYKEFIDKSIIVLRHCNHINETQSLVANITANREMSIVYTSILEALNRGFLSPMDIKRLKVFMDEHDSDDIRQGVLSTIFPEQAAAFDLLQDMSRQDILSFYRPKFNKKRVQHWLDIFGYPDKSNHPEFLGGMLSENPEEISRDIQSYYEKCYSLMKDKNEDDKAVHFQELYDTYTSKHQYFKFLPPINFSDYYVNSTRLERKRRLLYLAVKLLDYYHDKGAFPDDLELWAKENNVLEIIDPVAKKPFILLADDTGYRLDTPKHKRLSGITVKLLVKKQVENKVK